MEDFDHQVEASGRTDDGDENRFAAGLGRSRVAGWSAVDFASVVGCVLRKGGREQGRWVERCRFRCWG